MAPRETENNTYAKKSFGGQQVRKLIGTKESFYVRKKFSSHRTGLEHQLPVNYADCH